MSKKRKIKVAKCIIASGFSVYIVERVRQEGYFVFFANKKGLLSSAGMDRNFQAQVI